MYDDDFERIGVWATRRLTEVSAPDVYFELNRLSCFPDVIIGWKVLYDNLIGV